LPSSWVSLRLRDSVVKKLNSATAYLLVRLTHLNFRAYDVRLAFSVGTPSGGGVPRLLLWRLGPIEVTYG